MVQIWPMLGARIAGVMLASIDVVGAMVPPHLLSRAAAQSFDRQYVVPQPTANDDKADWWWMNAQAEAGVNGNPPANVQVIFYMGYLLGRPSADAPEFYATITGLFSNGSDFSYTADATKASVTSVGSETIGSWPGVGSFLSTPGKSFDVVISAPGVEGAISIQGSVAPAHYACNTTTSAVFSDFAPAASTSEESVLFSHLGWAVSIPGGRASVSLVLGGSPLTFVGTGYHDQNFIDTSDMFADVISQWFFGTAQVGEYVFSYLSATPFGSNATVTTGYLARNDIVLQNQCSVSATGTSTETQATNTNKLTRFGVIHSEASAVDVPQGYTIDYVLSNGERYSFTLTEQAEVVDLDVYHRSIGNVSGGKVGEPAKTAVGLWEWLNPGKNVYVAKSA
ncbi:hypothetical protein EUX98_g4404 [Antrodiella citrinella]|uniref:AttH domain-containing protein n=1 Tax=Antrodiella citrinella TaxID=2447956 RepID=A0A4S4MW13_9APHY|nr:hypothetical protein EUX98_g4404 [Antrodiella citrinella]